MPGRGQTCGYIRVSSLDQNTARQLDGLHVDRIFEDKISSKSADRPQLDAMRVYVRDGDTVVVHSMDRLARNLDDLRKLVRDFTENGIRVQFIKEGLTFTGDDSPWLRSCCQSWEPSRSSSARSFANVRPKAWHRRSRGVCTGVESRLCPRPRQIHSPDA